MNPIELAADALYRNIELLKMSVADFTDADFLARPCPGANHPTWQFGHLIVSETSMVNAVKDGAMPALPDGFDKKFSKETCASDDPKFFPGRKEIVEQLTKTRAGTIAWVKTLKIEDLARPAPEKMKNWMPTVGHLAYMLESHVAMHLGQVQVLRRKLGKPILF